MDRRDRTLVMAGCILVEAVVGSHRIPCSGGIDIRVLAWSHSCRDRLLLDVVCAIQGRGLDNRDIEGSINCE